MNEDLDNPRAAEVTHKADPPPYPGTPGWVKVLGIIALALILLLVVALLLPGGHGPGRHLPSGDARGQTPPLEHRAQQP